MATLGGFQLDLPDESATDRLGHAIAACLHPGDVVALDGLLGAGKTRLVRAIAIAAGADAALIHSPTYVLANEYPLPAASAAGLRSIMHVDAYRLGEDDERDGLIDPERAAEMGAAVLIEWADRLAEQADGRVGVNPIAGETALAIRLAHIGATARRAELSGHLAATVAERFGRTVSLPGDPSASQTSRPCRTCGQPVAEAAEHFPFCSHRCQLVDFGKWMDGEYRISRAIKDSDLDEGE